MESNPLNPHETLTSSSNVQDREAHPQNVVLASDSAVTKAEKIERHGSQGPPAKRMKVEDHNGTTSERRKGVAPIKSEFLINRSATNPQDDDAAEGAAHQPGKRREKSKGQNTARNFGSSKDEVGLCSSRATQPEFSPNDCQYGDKCRFEHDLRKYLKEWKRADLTTFEGICPIWKANGKCHVGWKCRFVGSHSEERETENGKELILTDSSSQSTTGIGTINEVSTQAKSDLMKRKFNTPKTDKYVKWLEERDDERATYVSPPFLPSEKRRLYFGPETPILAPLTTQGNLPFRRLCVNLGAQLTYSEMAMSLPLIQGQKSEWALLRAHKSEATPPAFRTIKNYDNTRDLKFGAQIAANKPWNAVKTAEILTQLCPHLRLIDLNCGCPIDLVYRTGAGSALLDSPAKMDKIVRGMNAVSDEIPITVKIRMGTKDNRPTALKLVDRLVYGGSGAAAITLHGRSRQQRYTKSADWEYIADCAALIKKFNERGDDLADTIREVDTGKVYFVGNGDCYSHVDYQKHLEEAKVDSVMVARGALIKPWIFEEIEKGQYLDKSASERLGLVEKFVKYGLETWGSDEMGVGTTRRFLLEWLSFAYRYVPVGILEYLPPSLQDRPPAWRGRNELETLLGSDNYKDWIKISYEIEAEG
ncbi:MAG: hypothetical protein Q9228_007568 [Teloschistes exilis]